MATSSEAARNSSGLLVRAACANSRGRMARPAPYIATTVTPPTSAVRPIPPSPPPAMAPSAKTIGTNARSWNNSSAKALRPSGPVVPVIGRTSAVEDSASAIASAAVAGTPTPTASSAAPIAAPDASSCMPPATNTAPRIAQRRRKDSSSPIEKSRSTIPTSAIGSIECGLVIVT